MLQPIAVKGHIIAVCLANLAAVERLASARKGVSLGAPTLLANITGLAVLALQAVRADCPRRRARSPRESETSDECPRPDNSLCSP